MSEQKIEIKDELIIFNLQATDNIDALTKMAENLITHGNVKESFTQAIIEREKVYPTGLQSTTIGVAIPHTDVEHVNIQAVSVASLKQPVEFVHMGTDDMNVEVSVIFMLAIKDPDSQLDLLQKLMAILQEEEVLERLTKSKDKAEVVDLIKKELL